MFIIINIRMNRSGGIRMAGNQARTGKKKIYGAALFRWNPFYTHSKTR